MKSRFAAVVSVVLLQLSSCHPPPTPPPDPQGELIARGRQLFFNETFNGNGRTCGTCHPAENNLTLDPAFIATLPPNNPLFVAELLLLSVTILRIRGSCANSVSSWKT